MTDSLSDDETIVSESPGVRDDKLNSTSLPIKQSIITENDISREVSPFEHESQINFFESTNDTNDTLYQEIEKDNELVPVQLSGDGPE